jgi:hypothetical protein
MDLSEIMNRDSHWGMSFFGEGGFLARVPGRRRYLLAGLLLTLPAFAMWSPRPWARELHLNNNYTQAALLALVAVCLVELTVVRSVTFNLVYRIRVATIAYVFYTAFLEIGQSFVGRHTALSDFLINSVCAAVAVGLFVSYRRRVAPARPYAELQALAKSADSAAELEARDFKARIHER